MAEAREVQEIRIEEEEPEESADGPVAEAIEDDSNAEGLAELNRQLSNISIVVQPPPEDLNPPPEESTRNFPKSYQWNTSKEKETLLYARNFERQFQTLYPQRRPLCMILKNDCGVDKFISTTIRPTLLPYPELDSHIGISSFVADFIAYHELSEPTQTPTELQSPSSTLWKQAGTCFDMSVVLCSLLQGAGYDAYCVFGYASKDTTTNGRFKTEKKLEQLVDKVVEEVKPPKVNKYKLEVGRKLASQYEADIQRRENERREKEAAQAKEAAAAARRRRSDPSADPLYGMRVHCWVLIRPGARGVPEAFFIEPTSGSALSTQDPNYLGVEFVFNSRNVWVNMQSCRDGLKDMDYNLQDSARWEYVFPDEDSRQTGASLVKRDAALTDVECAASWVEPLSIEPKGYQTRCPSGTRRITTHDTTIDLYAEYLNESGLIRRVTTSSIDDASTILDITCTFVHRHDNLIRKSEKFPVESAEASISWFYLPGHRFKLQEVIAQSQPTVQRRVHFFHQARADGACERIETQHEFTEVFKERRDRLVMRQAKYKDEPTPAALISMYDTESPLLNRVESILERYSRNPSVPEDQDIEEILFLPEAIQVKFYRSPGQLSTPTIELERPQLDEKQTLPAITQDYIDEYHPSKRTGRANFELHDLLTHVLKMEKSCRSALETNMQETAQILAGMDADDKSVNLEVSFYDTMRNEAARKARLEKEERAQEERDRQEKQASDYLAPFLLQLEDPEQLTPETAAQVREACLKDFSNRLTERAKLISSWYDKEKKLLQDKQEWFKENQASLSEAQEDEYVHFCSEANFRIQILVKRLDKHKKQASQLYLGMDQRLRSDPRLAPFLST